jgi:aminomethyltransferase
MSDPELRRSPLDDRHRGLGANMTGFGGWDMPLDYGSVVAEHRAVRAACGMFDLSHLGTLRVTGADAEAAVQRTFSNDASALPPGRAHYSLCLDEAAGIVDDLLVYRLGWCFLVVPNAANTAAVRAALEDGVAGDCRLTDVKDGLACIALQGPESTQRLVEAGVDVADLSYLDCAALPFPSPGASAAGGSAAGAPPDAGVVARSGYTGERGFELFVPLERAPALWDRLLDAGATPAGLGCRDTLRLEMGYPLHGQDISVQTTPVEARLGWAVKLGTGFRGEEAYASAKAAGPSRRLWGLRATGRGIPRAGCAVRRGEQVVGRVTSGTFSPSLRVGIALGYLDAGVQEGETVAIDVRGKAIEAEVRRPPFVNADPKR